MIQYFSERTGLQPEQLKFYSLSFSAVLDLFCHDKTKVVVLQGKAYITQHSLVDILCKMYRDELDKKLDAMKQHLDYIKTHHHLLPSLLRDIQFGDVTSAANSEYTPSEDLKKEDLPVLVPRSFPLCMQRLYNHVTREHHVRHFGRGQLNLFFKQIGLPLDQALDWWRAMFSPKYPGDKFDKEYAYTFRHNYGQEGKRANYSAPGCGRLITTEVGPTDSHGCPFKHLSGKDPNVFKLMLTNVLKNTVEDPSVRDSYVLEIQTLCADGHYQVACGTLFRYTHNGISAAENITHPVQYYRQSHEYYKDLKEKAEIKEKVATGVQKEPQMMTLE
jgi:DNA primase large subunit